MGMTPTDIPAMGRESDIERCAGGADWGDIRLGLGPSVYGKPRFDPGQDASGHPVDRSAEPRGGHVLRRDAAPPRGAAVKDQVLAVRRADDVRLDRRERMQHRSRDAVFGIFVGLAHIERSEEHTSELQSLMRLSYAGFCLKKKNITIRQHKHSL